MENTRKILNIKSISIATLCLLLIFLFLSKTLYNYNLPVITAASPFKGTLSKIELTTGIVQYKDVIDLYAEAGGKIDAVFVHEGDAVTKGQPVMKMNFDDAIEDVKKQMDTYNVDIQKKLSDLSVSREKLLVDIEKIDSNIQNTERKAEELNQEKYKPDRISDYDLRQCQDDTQKAEEELANAKVLFEAGVLSQQELTNAEYKLESLKSKYENLKRIYDDNVEKSNENITDRESSRQKQLKDYAYQLETYRQELKSKNLDLDSNATLEASYRKEAETKNAEYQKTLTDYENYATIYAPDNANVMSITVNKGQFVNANQHVASFGLSEEFIIECDVSLNNNFITVGDPCYLSNSSHTLDGVVTTVMPAERSKKITVSILSDEADGTDNVSAGETFEIDFEKESGESYTLVPNGAVNKDNDGYFLNQIKRRDGILGKEFYVEKLRVYIGDSDSQNTIIVKGVGFFEPIVLVSDKAFSEGETIKLKNEGDFFED